MTNTKRLEGKKPSDTERRWFVTMPSINAAGEIIQTPVSALFRSGDEALTWTDEHFPNWQAQEIQYQPLIQEVWIKKL